jgi:hypothetical protein
VSATLLALCGTFSHGSMMMGSQQAMFISLATLSLGNGNNKTEI